MYYTHHIVETRKASDSGTQYSLTFYNYTPSQKTLELSVSFILLQ